MSPHSLDETHADLRLAHQRLQQAYLHIDQALAAARRIQRSTLPRSLPQLPPLRLAVHHQSCGRAGGDTYDVFRLDETHVGLYVAQVTGSFLAHLRNRRTLPAWERPNMVAKYYVTTKGTELSREGPSRPAPRIAPR